MKIELNNVSKSYDKLVLNDLNLLVEGHSIVAIIGPSGSGKSTLLRQLSYIEEVDNGSILVNGIELNTKNKLDYHKRIGFVFQNHNLFPHLTLERNITLILENSFGYSEEDSVEIADKYLEQFELIDFKDKLPSNVSGGQAQRASIARALSTNPDIIFLDEPTSSLDPLLTYDVLEAVLELKKLQKDLVIVTHEINFIKEVADYFIYMEDGLIIEHGSINSLENTKNESLNIFLSKVL